MLLKITEDVAQKYPDNYYQSWDYPLWIIAIVLGFFAAGIFLKRKNSVDNEIQSTHYLSLFYIFLFLSATRIFYTLGTKFEGFDYETYIQLGYIFSMIGLTFFLFVMEKSIISKTKHILSLIGFIGIVLATLGLLGLIPRDIPRVTNGIFSAAGSLAVVLVHAYLVKKSTGDIRKRAFICMIGIIVLFLGVAGDSEIAYELITDMSVIVVPILRIIGTITVTYIQKY